MIPSGENENPPDGESDDCVDVNETGVGDSTNEEKEEPSDESNARI